MKKASIIFIVVLIQFSCGNKQSQQNESVIPRLGFLDFVQDVTVEQAHQGFMNALEDSGFSEADSTLVVHYVNAQGDIPTLGQACDLLLSEKPDLLATNVTLSTITAVQRTKEVPVFMIVSPRPDLAGIADKSGTAPANLSGVYETLEYIDTSVTIIKQLLPDAKRIGTVYNQSEPQSQDAFDVLERQCRTLGLELVALPVNNSAEAQLVTDVLLAKKIDVFFALPDNVIFQAFETILKSCNAANVPVFTSEAGLVSRGAVASFGADFYQWGYQSGAMAATYLRQGEKRVPVPQSVKIRKRLYNPEAAARFGIVPDSTFTKHTP
jgi:putative ABC transport system substrate-binding protein